MAPIQAAAYGQRGMTKDYEPGAHRSELRAVKNHSQAVGINPNKGTDNRGPAALSELSGPVAAVCLPISLFLNKCLEQRSYSCPIITCRDRGGQQAVSSVHKRSSRSSRETTHQAVLRESHPRSPTCSSGSSETSNLNLAP